LSLEFRNISGACFGWPNHKTLTAHIEELWDFKGRQQNTTKYHYMKNVPGAYDRFAKMRTLVAHGGKENYKTFIHDVFFKERNVF